MEIPSLSDRPSESPDHPLILEYAEPALNRSLTPRRIITAIFGLPIVLVGVIATGFGAITVAVALTSDTADLQPILVVGGILALFAGIYIVLLGIRWCKFALSPPAVQRPKMD